MVWRFHLEYGFLMIRLTVGFAVRARTILLRSISAPSISNNVPLTFRRIFRPKSSRALSQSAPATLPVAGNFGEIRGLSGGGIDPSQAHMERLRLHGKIFVSSEAGKCSLGQFVIPNQPSKCHVCYLNRSAVDFQSDFPPSMCMRDMSCLTDTSHTCRDRDHRPTLRPLGLRPPHRNRSWSDL